MSNQTIKKHPIYRGALKLVAKLRSIWLGRTASNSMPSGYFSAIIYILYHIFLL